MTFSRTALVAVGIAMVAGVAFGFLQYSRMPLQTADVSASVTPSPSDLLTGTWTSTDDASYSILFAADGTVTETYGPTTVSTGTYRFASSPSGYVADDAAFQDGGPRDYLLEDIQGDKLAYKVLTLATSSLELSYLDRGNTLSFRR